MPVQKGKCNFTVTKEYTAAEKKKKPLDHSDEQNIEGKIIVITGANSGIGEAAALEFAKRKAIVVMPCRNIKKAETVIEKIKTQVPDAQLDLLELDLGDFSSVRKCAEEIRGKYPKIDILINNAGFAQMDKKLKKNADGLEVNMAVNHLGPFLFTQLLLDQVKAAAPSRIVFTSSMGFEMGELDPEDFMLEKRGSFLFIGSGYFGPYCNAKLAMNYCVKILARKLSGTGVNVYALCPGYVNSGFQDETGFLAKLITNWLAIKPAEGAENILYCSIMNSTANQTGLMYRTNGIWENGMEQLDEEIGQQVWDLSVKYVGLAQA